MTKKELIKAVAEKTGTNKTHTEKLVNATLETIANTLVAGETVNLRGYLQVVTVRRKARKGRNPRTGAAVEIPEHNIVKWTTGQSLKDAVNG
jgi:DNA-binding protein HU-beta